MKFDPAVLWYQQSLHPISVLLLPFSCLFASITAARRYFYRKGLLKTYRFNVPVIVVGNITVGGTGKTPFVIALANFLREKGYRPGIVSRGVGGRKHMRPCFVKPDDAPEWVGDEALLLVRNTACPVVLGANRPRAVQALLDNTACDLIISDDGLQHYSLGRDIEIIMVDGVRRFGNQCSLPTGPLREPISRLHAADWVVVNGGNAEDEFTVTIEPVELISLTNTQKKISLADFPHQTVHAVAGIGHPGRFFELLEAAGLTLMTHVFPDHYHYRPADLLFDDSRPVIMTEKDAVKCQSFADERYWYLHITAKIDNKLEQAVLMRLNSLEAQDEKATVEISVCSDADSSEHNPFRR